MLLSLRKNGLDSLFKEVRVFKVFHPKGGNLFSSANKPRDVEESVQPSGNCSRKCFNHVHVQTKDVY